MITLGGTPRLETERLSLRAPVAGDWPHWLDFAQSARASYIGGPHNPETAWRAFGHAVGHWVLRGFGSFVFTARGSEVPLGMAGPWFPQGWAEKEIGWTIWSAEAEGKGYAFEAAQVARDFAFQQLNWDTAVSYIDARNTRSIALAKRLGAVQDPDAPLPVTPHDYGSEKEVLVFRHKGPAT